MTPEEWRRIKQIASDAWDRSDDARRAFIADACVGDEPLRQQVESLLQSADDAAQLFEIPALKAAGASDALLALTAADVAIIGTMVGPYRIVRELGHGGMGSVYLAQRADGEFD